MRIAAAERETSEQRNGLGELWGLGQRGRICRGREIAANAETLGMARPRVGMFAEDGIQTINHLHGRRILGSGFPNKAGKQDET